MRKLTLVQTCGACPEQYNVYHEGREVGYLRLRLRYGTFRAECMGETVYIASPQGDGVFEPDERVHYLNAACVAIDQALDKIELDDQEHQQPLYELGDPPS